MDHRFGRLVLASVAAAVAAVAAWSGCSSSPADQAATSAGGAAASGEPTSATTGAGGAGGSFAAPYDVTLLDDARIGSDSTMSNFQKADAEVDLHDGPFASVTLSVDLGTTCFPFSNWQTDPPPAGQNWPADCDAFDRNFEISFDDPDDATTEPPGIEVMRAITPFGGPEHQDVDITDVANGLAPGMHRLRVVIPTYSDGAGMVSGSNGGWNVTVKMSATPGVAPNDVLAVIPIFDSEQTDLAGPGSLSFQVPDGTTGGRLEIRATGHGGAAGGTGCIGPAEEFCERTFDFSVDAASLGPETLWRTDCTDNCTVMTYGTGANSFQYCEENPCGDMNSVVAPRANWCPGTLTPPLTFDPASLHAPGSHTLSWTLDQFVDGGEWRISAFYLAFGG